jgi:DNA-binding transcriptional MerR regulator
MTKVGDSVTNFLSAHREDVSGEVYGIGDLVRDFGVTARALRLYEEKALLSPRRLNGARIYSRRDRARLTLILRAKSLGSTLEDIKEYLDLYGQHGEGRKRQLEFVVSKTERAIRELEAKRAELERSLSELRVIHEGAAKQLRERRGR